MKNISHVASIVGRQRGVDPEEVEQALSCFFKQVESEMNTAQHAYVRVEHLGLFLMKPALIRKEIHRHIAMLRQLPKAHWRKETNSKIIAGVMLRLKQLLERRNEVAWTIFNYRMEKQARNCQRVA